MELETDEANLRADSSRLAEMDLYDDLIAFSGLSPEERRKELAERSTNNSEHSPGPVEERGGRGFELIGESSFELVDPPTLQPVKVLPAYTVEDFPFELPDEPASEAGREPSFTPTQADEPLQKKSDYLDLNYLLRVTGPLAAFDAAADEASPPLVCKDCGGKSSGEDMFCVTCGGLLDKSDVDGAAEVGAGQQACVDCGSEVEDGEIFCPSCGAVL